METAPEGIALPVGEAHSGTQKQSKLWLLGKQAKLGQTGLIAHLLGSPVHSGLSSSTT